MRNTIALTIAAAVTVALSGVFAAVVQPDPTAVEYAMPAAAVQPDATAIEYGL